MYRDPIEYAEAPKRSLDCPVCGAALRVQLAKGRKSGKTFLMAVCPKDGRHCRLFINDASYVAAVLERLEAKP